MAAHFTSDTISIKTAAEARSARLKDAASVNPAFNLPADGLRFSAIETSLYLGVFGEGTEGNARTAWVRTLFGECIVPMPGRRRSANPRLPEHERLPFEEGYKRPDKPLTVADLLELQKKVDAASAPDLAELTKKTTEPAPAPATAST